jgi:hypothetical protein
MQEKRMPLGVMQRSRRCELEFFHARKENATRSHATEQEMRTGVLSCKGSEAGRRGERVSRIRGGLLET